MVKIICLFKSLLIPLAISANQKGCCIMCFVPMQFHEDGKQGNDKGRNDSQGDDFISLQNQNVHQT